MTIIELTYTLSGESLSGESDEFFEKWQKFRPTNSFARRKVLPDEKFRPSGFFAQQLALCLMDHYWFFRERYCENGLFIYVIHDIRKIH